MATQNYPTNQAHRPSSSSSPLEIGSSSLSSRSLLSSTTSIPASPPEASINAGHYSMLIDNKFHELREDISLQRDDFNLSHLVECDNSTMLHLASSTSQIEFIDRLIEINKELLLHQNSNGDLAIHVAAKSCQLDAVQRLVFLALQHGYNAMLETVNKEKNTALHIALENHQKNMAELLFKNCPKTFYFVNEQGFSPLYLAIKAEFWGLAKAMLSNTEFEEAEEKLSEERSSSVVHAAIIAKNYDIFKTMVDNYNDLLYKRIDELGRRPLSYAAYTGFLDGVILIILTNKSFRNQAFKIDEDKNGSFPIHWACEGGDIKVVEAFFSILPEKTRLLLNKKGQNILHVAASSGKTKIVEFILGHYELKMMINMKDEDGNTPLHLAAKGKHARVVYVLTRDKRVILGVQNKSGSTALDIAEDYADQVPSFEERLTWLSLRYAGVPRAPKLHYLNVNIVGPDMVSPSNQTPRTNNDNATHNAFMEADQQAFLNLIKDHPKTKRKIKYKERINTLLVVATLVATVTFASGFTIPGGYNNGGKDEGLATLAQKVFFQVFVISDTIAMYSAILSLVTLIWAHLEDPRLVLVSLDFALPLLGIALAMMSVAFTAALYVVVHKMVFWLGVVVLIMGGLFLVVFLVFFLPLYSPTSCISNNFLRCICRYTLLLMLLVCEKGKSS